MKKRAIDLKAGDAIRRPSDGALREVSSVSPPFQRDGRKGKSVTLYFKSGLSAYAGENQEFELEADAR